MYQVFIRTGYEYIGSVFVHLKCYTNVNIFQCYSKSRIFTTIVYFIFGILFFRDKIVIVIKLPDQVVI